MAVRSERLGPRDPATLASRARFGILLGDEGDFERAETVLREVLADRGAVLGESHPQTLTWMANLSALLRATGREDEAAALEVELGAAAAPSPPG